MAGGVAAVFGIACALVKVLCGCRCHRGSVTIRPSPYQTYRQKGGGVKSWSHVWGVGAARPYHRLVCGSAEQQDG